MTTINWTEEQKNAIYKKNSNILVAAAAGSGKTAVLVERIIRKIIDDKVDIDKILVVTFTNAAASEMREKILEAIYKKIDENPDDKNMQRQVNLLNKSSICTIDSFCLDVIKNNFYEIDASANARIADTTEIDILKQETIDDIFEEKYMNNDKQFLNLIETYTKYNKDEDLSELILKIYSYIQSSPFPEEWLNEKIEMFDNYDKSNFSNTIWGKIIINNVKDNLEDFILKLENISNKMKKFSELDKFQLVIEKDINNYKTIKNNLNDWDKTVHLINFKQDSWPKDKKVTNELKLEAKEVRDSVKENFKSIKELIPYETNQANQDIDFMYKILKELQQVILEFTDRFNQKKREKNIMDFNDMEHLALKILVNKYENGKINVTEVAKKYQKKFEEIAIDEYQDSNLVQEFILTSVSRNNNIFMVGDVKQSIYKFRQARPELFLQKYNEYKLNPGENENRKIQLFKNFRSRKNILDLTNLIFKDIMSTNLGEIDYNESEYLNLGANYEDIVGQDLKTEVDIIDLKDPEEDIWKANSENERPKEDDETEEIEESERVENFVLQARYTAQKIKQLIDSKYQVIDKKQGKRDIKYKDIAILLRSPGTVATVYEKEISEQGIPVYSDSSDDYLQTVEIDTIMSLLKIINNPMQDIPLVTVLRSIIGNITDNELIEISFQGKKESFYEKLLKTKNNSKNIVLVNKIEEFLTKLKEWREEEKYKPLDELIWKIYIDTGFMNYVSLMQNGELRVANLKMLFEKAKQYESASFKGLYNFITFMSKVKISSNDMGAAKIIGENENVVRIMSIHKSKGLEFPVVLLVGTEKNFNFSDFNENILLHQDLGIGPQYIDSNRHIQFKTLPKKALTIVAKKETISEEMRILYVALTRAKEKLIIIGLQKDVYKSLSDKEKALEIYRNENINGKINSFLVQKYKSYLDFIELVYKKEGIENTKDLFTVNVINKKQILLKIKEAIKEQTVEEKIKERVEKEKDENKQTEILNLLQWEYNFNSLENVPSKTSVTKLKELKMVNAAENITKTTTTLTDRPKFIDEEENNKLTGAEKGTLMHLCVQKMNEQKQYDSETIKEMIRSLVNKEIITSVQADNINTKKLLDYTESNLWQELKNAKEIHKEQAFYINMPVSEIYDTDKCKSENVLVQGVIDLFYIDSNDKLVLVDYKTDYIKPGDENSLVDKYKEQLKLYKQALEQSLNKKVDKVCIYSLYTNKEVIL